MTQPPLEKPSVPRLLALGEANPLVVALDADVKNSTYSDKFGKRFPDRFLENFIAEQNMLGAAAGIAACGKIPFVATFAAFFTRAYDFIRMAAISQSNIKLVGTHVGVSIGEDGPSQMGLEDLAMMSTQPGVTVLYPSDALSMYKLVEIAAAHKGMVYLRAGRPKTPVIYGPDEIFRIGGSKVVRQSAADKLTIVAAGVTLFEALKAHDQLQAAGIATRVVDLYSIVPVDRATLIDCARATGGRFLTVEDHYAHGGIGDTVLSALALEGVRVQKLAVREIPRSGKRRNSSIIWELEYARLSKRPKQLPPEQLTSGLPLGLNQIPLLKILSAQDRQQVLGEMTETRYGKGQYIFREGDPTEYFHIVKEGCSQVCQIFPRRGRSAR